MLNLTLRLLTVVVAALAPTGAFAHPGHSDAAGFVEGLMHPFSGLDHVLAMAAVGILAFRLGGRALWLLPLVFVLVMGAGGALGIAKLPLSFAEIGIATSIIALGIAIALRSRMPLAIVAAMVGVFAVFHGFSHGAEMPLAGSATSYSIGFMTATTSLHLIGIGVGFAIAQLDRYDSSAYRVAGSIFAVAGAALLTQMV